MLTTIVIIGHHNGVLILLPLPRGAHRQRRAWCADRAIGVCCGRWPPACREPPALATAVSAQLNVRVGTQNTSPSIESKRQRTAERPVWEFQTNKPHVRSASTRVASPGSCPKPVNPKHRLFPSFQVSGPLSWPSLCLQSAQPSR